MSAVDFGNERLIERKGTSVEVTGAELLRSNRSGLDWRPGRVEFS